MRNNHKKAKRLQQVRGKTLRTNPNLQNVKPAFKTKSALSIFVATVIGCSSAIAVQQSSVASVTSNTQNMGNLNIATSSTIASSSGGDTPLSNSNSGYYSSTSSNSSFNSTAAENNFMAVKKGEQAAAQNIQTNIESCATDGIGKVVKDNLDLQMTVWGRPIDINKMFSPASQGGCFADIGKIIDLSVTIPSLDTIINAAQQMVVDYATKKACDAMKTASTELVGPLNDVIGEINKAGQYTDVSGALGTAVNGQLGKLDPGLVMPSGAFEGGDTYTINGSRSTGTVSYSTDQKASTSTPSNAKTSSSESTSVTQSIKDFFS